MFSEKENINIEIKAKITDCESIRKILLNNSAEFKGIDEQTDTYYKVGKGRLKLREGNIENCLVFYEREDQRGPKKCKYSIIKFFPDDPVFLKIKNILEMSLGILVTVEKKREIYFIENVKFHIDSVKNLGNFFEIEAIKTNNQSVSDLISQCERYLKESGINKDDLIKTSYSDMIIEKNLFKKNFS